MPKIKGCAECPDFRYTFYQGYFCAMTGFKEMVKNKTLSQFNKDYHSGKLFEFVQEWCLKNRRRSG